eukprot:PITA_20970
MEEDGKHKVEKFKGQNFSLWNMKMEHYLYQKNLYLPFGGKKKIPTSMTDEEWNLLDIKALETVQFFLAASATLNISKETMKEGLVKSLAKLYKKHSALNKVFLMKRLFNMKISEGGSISDHLNDFNTVTSHLSSITIKFDDEVRALLFFCSLLESWNGLVMAITNCVFGSSTLTFDYVVGAILSEEMRRKRSGETSDSEASFHATPDKKYFDDYVQGDFGQVHLGDDKPCKIVEMGKVLIKRRNGNQWLLKEVRHVSDLKKNLISTGQLGSEGCVTTFRDKVWKVTKGALVIEKGEKVGTLYLWNGISNSVNDLTSKGADAALWHHRFKHMSEKGMKILNSRNLLPGSIMQEINVFKRKLENSFAMKDLGAAKQILGMIITKDKKNRKLTLCQNEYIQNVLKRFNMHNAKPLSTPFASHLKLSKEMCSKTQEDMEYISKVTYASAVGSLLYAMVCIRPDIAHAVGVVSRYMNNPRKEHWVAVKWILRYLKGTTNQALCFGGSNISLQGYVDADMAGDIDNRRSTT